jgi:hypothetical protein
VKALIADRLIGEEQEILIVGMCKKGKMGEVFFASSAENRCVASCKHACHSTKIEEFLLMTTSSTMNNPAGKYASVNGINLYYELHGTGSPLIMLHGGFGTFDMFAALNYRWRLGFISSLARRRVFPPPWRWLEGCRLEW